MADSILNLHVLDSSSAAKELDLASELFHRINRVIPQDQIPLTFPPTCLARDAIATMLRHGYSQVPVVQDGIVLGVFSFRSFSRQAGRALLVDITRQSAPGDWAVDEFLERFEFARVTEEMVRVFDAMERDNGVLIGTPERLIGILTPMDFLRYLYRVASPFVMLSEIELALRALIRTAMSEEQIASAARRCLLSAYRSEDNVPTSLEEMSFDNYQSLVSHGDNWTSFEPVFRGTRQRTSGKLREVGSIRNDLFHFKREITIEDHQTLSDHRDWLLTKVKQMDGYRRLAGQS